jgi:peptidoglycan hydrolase CwlO-like protein
MTSRTRIASFAAAALFAITAVVGVPQTAYADTSAELQQQLEEAKTKRDELYAQASAASEELNETIVQLEQTQSKIDETNAKIEQTEQDIQTKQEELDASQEALAKRVSADYKTGGVSFLSIILDASSFDDFISRVYYADKISESDAAAIQQVKDLRAELEQQKADLKQQQADLEQQKADQEALKTQQEAQQQDLAAKAAEADDYVNSLDTAVK